MKRIVIRFFSLFFLLFTLSASIYAQEPCYRWYFKKTADHTPPPCPSDLAVIEKYSAFYCNPSAKEEKVIYLTFDAGYENENVVKILDVLRAHQARAAFFILEHLVKSSTPLVRTMLTDGHLVCNHTATHKNMSRVCDYPSFEAELLRMEKTYRDVMGCEIAKFYRPPEGSFCESNLAHAQKMGYTTVFWSFAYADWDNQRQPDPQASLERLLSHLHNGEILLLHPTSATNARILGAFLTEAQKQGYRFGSLEELCHAQSDSSVS